MSSESGGGEAGDGGQNLIGRFGPSKWFRLLVVDDDEFADGRFQLVHAAMGTSFDLALGEQRKPAFYLVQPGRVRGSEVKVVARSAL